MTLATGRTVRQPCPPPGGLRSADPRGTIGSRYGSEFDEARVRKVADGARAKFEGMPGVTGLYGVKPTVEYAQVAARVENIREPARLSAR